MKRLTLIVPLLLVACEPADEAAVQVDVYTAEGTMHDGILVAGPADLMELVVERPDGPPLVETFSLSAGTGSVTSIPVGDDLRITARGFRGDEPTVHFYGASARFSVADGDSVRVPVQVGRGDCIGLNRVAQGRDGSLGGKADLQDRRIGATFTPLPDGRVLIAGGAEVGPDGAPERVHDTVELFDPVYNQMLRLPWRLDEPRAFHTATLLDSGQILIVGGINGVIGLGQVSLSDRAALIDIDGLRPVRQLPDPIPAEPRARHQAVALHDSLNTVLIVGGEGAGGAPLASAVRFFPPIDGDPIDGIFREQGDLHEARVDHTANRLGRTSEPALIAGGRGAAGALSSVELFTLNPAQAGCAGDAPPSLERGCFIRPAGVALPSPRYGHAAVTLGRGLEVLVVGGYAGDDRSDALDALTLVDAANFSAADVGQLDLARGDLAAVEVNDGLDPFVLAVGGRSGGAPKTAAERLNRRVTENGGERSVAYVSEPLADGCALSEARSELSAVGLDNRTVLLIGGLIRTNDGFTGSRRVEFYFPRVNAF
ncbi:MAG: hypothetical protein KC620_17210 [Myxococcales bacterium]|nr:hypothetical protein [Myxococcales bacterium]